MRAGLLKHRIDIEERAERLDEVGDPIPYWRVWRTVWAAVEPIGGREGVVENQIHAAASTRIRMRYQPGVNAKMRARWNDRLFNIDHVDDLAWGRQETVLLCSDGLNDG